MSLAGALVTRRYAHVKFAPFARDWRGALLQKLCSSLAALQNFNLNLKGSFGLQNPKPQQDCLGCKILALEGLFRLQSPKPEKDWLGFNTPSPKKIVWVAKP